MPPQFWQFNFGRSKILIFRRRIWTNTYCCSTGPFVRTFWRDRRIHFFPTIPMDTTNHEILFSQVFRRCEMDFRIRLTNVFLLHFFSMSKMYEENNVTPYFYNNFRSHCQFDALKLFAAPNITRWQSHTDRQLSNAYFHQMPMSIGPSKTIDRRVPFVIAIVTHYRHVRGIVSGADKKTIQSSLYQLKWHSIRIIAIRYFRYTQKMVLSMATDRIYHRRLYRQQVHRIPLHRRSKCFVAI